MAIKDDIVKKKPREKAGARAARGFDFQRDWALCELLRLHAAGGDYLILFDYQDDVVVLNGSTSPTTARFFQVKTKDKGRWTHKALIKRNKGKKTAYLPSILGKLYGHRVRFGIAVESVTLVSTAAFSIPLSASPKSTERSQFTWADIKQAASKVIREAMKVEHSLTNDPDGEDTIVFFIPELHFTDHPRHTTGHLAEFLDKQGYKEIPAAAAYRAIITEIKRLNNSGITASSFDELSKCKALSRVRFGQMLATMHPGPATTDFINVVRSQLEKEGESAIAILRIATECRRFFTERTDTTNHTLRDAVRDIDAQLKAINSDPANTTAAISAIRSHHTAALDTARGLYGNEFLDAATLVTLYDQ